jgi:Peptidase family M28
MYRGTWLLVGVPLLVAAFSVGRPVALPAPTLPPTFDGRAALALAGELAGNYPDRSPGSPGAHDAARWVTERLRLYGFTPQVQDFEATIPGRGRVQLRNLIAIAEGRSPDAIVVMAHRDDSGVGPGANDNASGTAALIELARAYARARTGPAGGGCEQGQGVCPANTIIFLSSDGGAFGNLGAEHFAQAAAYRDRITAVLNLDAVAGEARPRIMLAGDRPRSPAAALVQTAANRILEQSGQTPARPSALRQLIDLGFPFSLYGQAPFVSRGIAAITLTSGGDRPPTSFGDTVDRLNGQRLDEVGRSAQALLGSLDQGLELPPGPASYVYLGPRMVPGWAIQLSLIAMLLPFLAATVDLFARCRRRRIRLAPALRSYRSRLAFWLFLGLLFGLFAVLHIWPSGADRPPSPEDPAIGRWPVVAFVGLAVGAALAWLVVRDRLIPRRAVRPEEELAGYTAALLVLGVLSLLVVATNAFALLFLLPSLHAWLWLPQVRSGHPLLRVVVFAAGLTGPFLLLGSLAFRFGLGFDAPWYLATLVAIGFVDPTSVAIALGWFAAAGQLAALTVKRYAPYPAPDERRPRGPLRELIRRIILASRRRKAAASERVVQALER